MSAFLEKIPGNDRYYAILAEMQIQDMGLHQKAVEMLRKAIVLNPHYSYYS